MNPSVKAEMIQHIHAHNKILTPEYLEDLGMQELLAECHPVYREYFTNRIKNANKVDE